MYQTEQNGTVVSKYSESSSENENNNVVSSAASSFVVGLDTLYFHFNSR